MIWYFHGFNSQSSREAELLQTTLGVPLTAPRYTDEAEYFGAIENAVGGGLAMVGKRPLFIGTSLGGFAAYCAARRTNGTAFLINPCLRPWDTLQGRAPETWLQRAKVMAESLPAPHGASFVAFINEDDELLAPFQPVFEQFGITRVIVFPAGGHRAENFASEIVPALLCEYQNLR